MEYSFTLKDNNQKIFRRFVWFLFFLHVLAAGILAMNSTDRNTRLSLNVLLGFYALVLTGYYFFRKRDKAFDTFSFIMALLYANFWLKHAGLLALIAFLLMYLFVLIVQGKKTTVHVSDSGVAVTRIFKTMLYSWSSIDNLVLKDNLMTIDLRSNRIIQAELFNEIDPQAESAFNSFCTSRLGSVHQTGAS